MALLRKVVGQLATSAAMPLAYDSGSATDGLGDRSPDSSAMLDYWIKVQDIVTGHEAVTQRGTKYLPKFPDEEQNDYNFRLSINKFTNVYRDIVEGLSSKPFSAETSLLENDSKPIPEQLLQFVEDVDGSGNNLTAFASEVFFNAINSAIHWIFVDYSKPDEPEEKPKRPRTRAVEQAMGLRPFWSQVAAINVLECRSAVVAGKEVWTYFRIFEPGKPNHVRVMQMIGKRALWELYEEKTTTGAKKEYTQVEAGEFTIGAIPMVPVTIGRRDGKRYFYFPPMRDAADLQMNLYRNESALEFAKTMSCFPMLAGQGVTPERNTAGEIKPMRIGPNRTIYAPGNTATGTAGKWESIEPSAESLKFLAADIAATIQQIRELGRQPLTSQSGNLTVITTAMVSDKARSAVAGWALGLKNSLENAFVLTGKWFNIPKEVYDPEVFVYTDFDNFTDGKTDVEALGAARERGDLSLETYWSELQRRRILSPEFKGDEERKKMLAEVPGDAGDDELPDDPVTPPVPENEE